MTVAAIHNDEFIQLLLKSLKPGSQQTKLHTTSAGACVHILYTYTCIHIKATSRMQGIMCVSVCMQSRFA